MSWGPLCSLAARESGRVHGVDHGRSLARWEEVIDRQAWGRERQRRCRVFLVRLLCYTASVRVDPLLAGIVVLDFTRVLAGPYCTRLLADLGARVVKVEQPGRGDEMRRGPHQLEDAREDQSTYFVRCNAGKESIALD